MGNKKQTGRVNYIWILAGGYLLYLAFQLVKSMADGDAGSPVVSVIGAVVFTAAAVLLFLREWKAYQYGKAHIDDPETWSDESAEELPEDEDREDL